MKKTHIDGGRSFDFGRASVDYARYRDIYPPKFYQRLLDAGLCTKGQKILDLGTGTGVLPRNLYLYGAEFTGVDLSESQIAQARILSEAGRMKIRYLCLPVEAIEFPEASFDGVTACQCFTYFDHPVLAPKLRRILKDGGKFAVLYMSWLPFEDEIARRSEELILKYNPDWTGGGETRHPIEIPDCYWQYFTLQTEEVFDLRIRFTRESWNGRLRSCRGIGSSSLPAEKIRDFEREHMDLLEKTAPPEFEILHYAAVTVLRTK